MNQKSKSLKIIISGGGTGGHIFPALSIARAIQRRNNSAEILFVGAHHRMEMEMVPAAGFKIVGLPISGFQRRITWQNLTFFPKLIISLIKCKSIIKAFNPDVVVGVGGYASGPLLRIAQKLNIPTLIQEQNSYAGLTNKLLAAKAKRICVAYDKMGQYFPSHKIVNTGNPVRKDLQDITSKSSEALQHFNLHTDKKTLLVIGGSLGALTINQSIAFNLDELIRKDIQVIWQTGKSYYEQARKELTQYSSHNVQVFEFINKMNLAYSVADVIISRAGAGTISELCIIGKPIILVPSPNVAEDHQTKNALALVDKEAAIMVNDSDAKELLINELLKLMADDNKWVEMQMRLHKLAKPNADEHIVDELLKLVKQ
ncbi:MAG: undecaprenyldiphospho-muramoylpentapeptide beta-N-acetylglucosaminyltransferase [Salinivirgaceae bacterium]|jgi:UDP-N-acetylglucosamine--N-acetylmuramyl-(pentapeptide) pyrophosphoryl-undecaprenol N-acetylglucosamine transferase|nr:undecaprenyldiphospho-muramoylpentapeptide beta-N-acetylglucosaminyltransferase [Salinivirgaceae bacterium]